MNRHRTRIELIRDVLRLLNMSGAQLKSHIVYKCNLNDRIAKEILGCLIAEKAVRKNVNPLRSRSSRYTITGTGVQWLRKLNDVLRLTGL